MANADGYQNFEYSDSRNGQFNQFPSRMSWPLQHAEASAPMAAPPVVKRSTSPLPMSSAPQNFAQTAQYPVTTMMQDWQTTTQAPPTTYGLETALPSAYEYGVFQTSPTEYLAPQTSFNAHMNVNMGPGMDMNTDYVGMSMGLATNELEMNQQLNMNMPMPWPNADIGADLVGYGTNDLQDMTLHQQQQAYNGGSPSSAYLSDGHIEVQSITSNGSDHGWSVIVEQAQQHGGPSIFNPEATLHPRSLSDSSYSDIDHQSDHQSRSSLDGYVDVPNVISSPGTDCASTESSDSHSDHDHDSLIVHARSQGPPSIAPYEQDFIDLHQPHRQTHVQTSPPLSIQPIAIRQSDSTSPPQRSPVSPTISRKAQRKPPTTKTTAKTIQRKSPPASKSGDLEKRVGRRKGPLRPDQRKQASEIRKLGACIRCRFLKKTCDKGEPCGGCKPSHARLWLVPCTRIDIKDLGYFLKDWQADYQRHVSLGFSIGNIKGFSDKERTLFVTHGYGNYLPIQAREVYVRDERVFGVDWVESKSGQTTEHEVDTARLSAGMQGVSTAMLSDYLDRHIDGSNENGFEHFVDEHFEGTPFITEILKTAFRFWQREQTPVIRKALKLMLAYNLTQAICLVRPIGDDDLDRGIIDDEESYFHGQMAAPVMINFQVKCAMADMWRALQKDVLEELSTLYSSVYSKDKLRHWPTIFMLASILLTIWEEMQFDCRYRIPDQAVVEKFCNDMESTPVGVIVGLFSAISQKVPAFIEWDTRKHYAALGSNQSVCTAMEEVRSHIEKHDKYLRTRNQAKFDRNDFDCLSNMFVSKLVIRAH